MPQTIQDEAGNSIEVLTKEEVDAKVAEATKTVTDEAKTKVDNLTSELDKLRASGANAGALRDKNDEIEKANADLAKKVEEASATAQSVQQRLEADQAARVGETKNAAIKRLVGDDKALQEKVEFHFDKSTAGPAGTKEEIEARVRNAYLIASGERGGVLNGPAVSAATGSTTPSAKPLSPEAMDLGARFGIPQSKLEQFGKPATKA